MYKYLLLLPFILLAWPVNGQKVKYKDLFPLLSSEQYAAAEADLRRYIADNDDNPNAYMFMGYLLQAKLNALDVLKAPDRAAHLGDSAVQFLELSLKGIDDREIKKHDEYYQRFAQRDQRSGEYGIDLGNIQYELKKRIADIKDRQQRIVRLTKAFRISSGTYVKNQEAFRKLVSGFKSYNDFLLRGDQSTLQGLRRLKERHDSVENIFKSFKSYYTQLGNMPYTPSMKSMEIEDITRDGMDPADFFAHEVAVWNYRSFADKSIDIIEQDILPMQDNLLKIDAEIQALANRVKNDSVSVLTDLSRLQQRLSDNSLLKYDSDPLPFAIFRVRIADLQYGSEVAAGRAERGSGNLVQRLARLRRELRSVQVMDSISSVEMLRDLQVEESRYSRFVRESYSSIEIVSKLFQTSMDFARVRRDQLKAEIDELGRSIRYLNDGNRKIPAVPGVQADGYYPLFFDPENFTMGVSFTDALKPTGYFYRITPERQADLKAEISLDSAAFSVGKVQLFKALMASAPSGEIFFPIWFSTESNFGRFNVVVSKVYKVDGLAWSGMFSVEGTPVAATFIKETGGISITLDTPGGGQSVYLISKDGKGPNP